MKVDRSKPSEGTLTIDGQAYKTTVYPEIPELPEGYYINEQGDLMQGASLVIFKNHAKHKEALIAFLKGAR